jgi:alkylhydroperoxidase family enzyme
MLSHGAVASAALDDASLVDAVLADFESAPTSEQLRATLRMLRRLTLEPDRFGPEDVESARAAGVSDAALTDAIYVCALFSMLVRCADSLAFTVPTDFTPSVRMLLSEGAYARIVEGA